MWYHKFITWPLWVILLITSLSPFSASAAPVNVHRVAMIPTAQRDLDQLGDLPRYWIEMTIDLEARVRPNFTGRERILFTNHEKLSLKDLYLRLYPNGGAGYGNGRLTVTEIRLDGQPVRFQLEIDGTAVRVPLPEPLAPGEELMLEAVFTGRVANALRGEGIGYGVYSQLNGLLTLANGYPILAVLDDDGWNLDPVGGPGDAVYSDVGLYEVSITVPETAQVAASGIEMEASQNGNGTVTHRYVSGPMRDFFIAVGDRLSVLSEQVGDTVVNAYFLPEDASGGSRVLEIGVAALELFNRRFGLYPYKELDIVELPVRRSLGVEYPGIVLIAKPLYQNPDNFTLQMFVSHEVAHQWWYGVLGNDVIEEPWLDEALATYTSVVYLEEVFGARAAQDTFRFFSQRYQDIRARGIQEPITAPAPEFARGGYTPVVYYGGALFYRAIREQIGDAAFDEGLRTYYQQFKYRIATSTDLLKIFEQISGQELDPLYEQWLFSSE
ncbi:MAG: M1 family metallopeptidase [Candidatus Bipolaricaulia bacterium]